MSEVAVAIRDELGELQGTATSSSMLVEHELRVVPIATVAVGPSGQLVQNGGDKSDKIP
jgi:hypothetical protein